MKEKEIMCPKFNKVGCKYCLTENCGKNPCTKDLIPKVYVSSKKISQNYIKH